MSDNQTQILIDHLDKTLSGAGSPEIDQLIRENPETNLEWSMLRLAVDAVQDAGLYEQIGAVKSAWLAQQTMTAASSMTVIHGGGIVRSMSMARKAMRIAAGILVLAIGMATYKYTVTSSAGLYEKYYSGYQLNTTRGAGVPDAIDQAYTAKNWAGVTTLFNTGKERDNKSYFLAGMADLESKRYDDAIEKFRRILTENAQSGSDTFQDEAEFYLAMSWLAKDNVKEAMPLVEKMRADKGHLYHDVVVRMSSLDLRIAGYKSDK
jgi:tetratricopeptide (TPR) repeat protein